MKHTHHIFKAFALSICCAAYALAQNSSTAISGRVTDPQGAGIAGAIVTLYERQPILRLTTVTDANGAYHFGQLTSGDYLIEVEAQGFAPATAHTLRVERGEIQMLDLSLQLAGVHADVVVTASDTAQPVDEVSKAITTINRSEIEERNEFLIPEALRTVPGLRVQQLGGPGAFVSIKTRGLPNQDTAVLIDGLRFRDASAPQGDASGYLSDLFVADTSRVEVLRGSGSSLYGTNAIGGVINIVTDEGGGPLRGNLLLEGGSLGLFRGRAQLAGGAHNDRVAYSVGVAHLNVTRGVDGDDAARNTSGQGRVLFRLAPNATLSARLYASDSFLQLNDDPRPIAGTLPSGSIIRAVPISRAELRRYEAGAPASQLDNAGATFIPSANDPDNSRTTRFLSGVLVFTHRPRETFGYTISYQGNLTNGTFRDGPGGTGFEPFGNTRTDLDGRVQTINARTDFRLGTHNLINAGYEFENEKFINRTFPETISDNSTISVIEHSHAVFIQDQLHLLDDRLQLSAAFRAQHFTLNQPKFAPVLTSPFRGFNFDAPPNAYTGDGSIAYLFRSTGTKLRTHVGNGYRAPSLFERFGTFFSSFSRSFEAFGDPRLRPERSIAFDAGIDQTLADNRVRASATYFYTRLQEVIAFDFTGLVAQPDPFGRFGGYVNTRGGLARGVELSAEVAPAPALVLTASYTYTNSDERTPRVANIIRAFAIPAQQFSLVATEHIGRRLFFNFDLTLTSNYLAPVFNPATFGSLVYRFDGTRKADVGASYTVPLAESRSLRLFGLVENVFGHEYFENGFRTPRRTARAGAQFNF